MKPVVDPSGLRDRLRGLPGLGPVSEAARGRPAYLVGGAVRDLLLGAQSPDLDIAIEEEVGPLVEALGDEATLHDRFETASVIIGEVEVDVARTRAETYSAPGALPRGAPGAPPRGPRQARLLDQRDGGGAGGGG